MCTYQRSARCVDPPNKPATCLYQRSACGSADCGHWCCLNTYTHTHRHTHAPIQTQTHTHTYTYTRTHTHTHTRTCTPSLPLPHTPTTHTHTHIASIAERQVALQTTLLIFLKTDDAAFGSHSADDVEGLPCMYENCWRRGRVSAPTR